jgi:hypothetical protein
MDDKQKKRCTSCGPVPYGAKTVKLNGEDFTFPLIHYPQCESTDTGPEVDTLDPGIVYHHCMRHKKGRK